VKYLIFLLLFLSPVSFAQEIIITTHNESNQAFTSAFNQALKLAGVEAECSTRRVGRYTASQATVDAPERWEFDCKKTSVEVEDSVAIPEPQTQLYWEPQQVGGEEAVRYRILYGKVGERPIDVKTNELNLKVGSILGDEYSLILESYDKFNHSIFCHDCIEKRQS